MFEIVAGELRAKLGTVSAMRQLRSGRDTCAVTTRLATRRHRKRRRCGGRRRDRRAWLRCPWAVAGPGRGAGRRRQGQGGPRDRPLRAKLACGDLAGGPPPTSTHSGQAHQGRPRDGRKSAEPYGAQNTGGTTSNMTHPRMRKPRPADAGRDFRYPVGYEV